MASAIFADWGRRAPIVATYSNLAVSCLDVDQHGRTCGYWYCVQSSGTAHTAFRTRAALEIWLCRTGLRLASPLPDSIGQSAWIGLIGSYDSVMHLNAESFAVVVGTPFAALNNGQYRACKSELLPDNRRALHSINCNVDQVQFDYRLTSAAIDTGDDNGVDPSGGPMRALPERLPAFHVTYEDGLHYVTSMALGTTLEAARAYFVGTFHVEECDLTGKETRRRVTAVDPA